MPTRRLLILDDDSSVGQTIELIAQAAGLETLFTQNPEDFFVHVASWSPDFIAIDLVMPQMDGVEVLTRLAERQCSAKIIITSGVGHRILDAASRSASERGLNIAGVLSKPFMPATLRQMLGDPRHSAASGAPTGDHGTSPERDISALDIQQALEDNQFYVVFQPKIQCHDRRINGFEVLLRWVHPQLGNIVPDRFIPAAERFGLINTLTQRVFDLGFGWFAANFRGSRLRLSVNISAKTVMDEAFVESITDRCARLGLAPEQIICELTETSAMEDPVASLGSLTRLRMKGVHLSIDDLGTGFSSLLQLVRLPFSELKVDKSFVISASRSSESRQVIKAIVGLGQSLDMQTTAEGVEDAETLRFLEEIGCNLAQGFFIARPMKGEDALRWVADYQGPGI